MRKNTSAHQIKERRTGDDMYRGGWLANVQLVGF